MLSEIALVILFLLLLYHFNRKPQNLPPGIWGLPLIGQLPGTDIAMADQVKKYSKTYGDIFTWRIGGVPYIFVCNYELIKTAMNKIELADRPPIFSLGAYTNNTHIGIVYASGKVAVANRRFTMRHLRDLGMGKTQFETVIQDEVTCFMNDLEKSADGQPRPIPWSLNVSILNVIWRITADRRYEVNDPDIQRFNELNDRLFKNVGVFVQLYDLIPWLPKIVPSFFNKWSGVDDLLNNFNTLKEFLIPIIESHQKSFDPANPRDYIDFYLIEMDKQKDDPDNHRNYSDLLAALVDLFVAGSETTANMLRWSIYYMARYPDIQKKVQDEIDSVVEEKNIPSLTQKGKLPYLDAVCMEIQRHISLTPLAVGHYAVEDVTLEGYTIPKGSVVMPSINTCHSDPDYFEKPDEFYPEHFLDTNGEVILKKEGYIPFNVGKRACPGESLAYMEIYIFMTGIFKNFSFILPEGEEFNTKRNPKDRLVNSCRPYNVIIKTRKGNS